MGVLLHPSPRAGACSSGTSFPLAPAPPQACRPGRPPSACHSWHRMQLFRRWPPPWGCFQTEEQRGTGREAGVADKGRVGSARASFGSPDCCRASAAAFICSDNRPKPSSALCSVLAARLCEPARVAAARGAVPAAVGLPPAGPACGGAPSSGAPRGRGAVRKPPENWGFSSGARGPFISASPAPGAGIPRGLALQLRALSTYLSGPTVCPQLGALPPQPSVSFSSTCGGPSDAVRCGDSPGQLSLQS